MLRYTAVKTLLKVSVAIAALSIFNQAVAQQGLVGRAIDLPTLTLSSGEPLAKEPIEIEAGVYYEIIIKADGSAEMALSGPRFFRNLWIDEIVINDIEIRPLGIDSIEFDDEGEAEISFIAIKPGRFELRATGAPPLLIIVNG